jgi:hypothetical protein
LEAFDVPQIDVADASVYPDSGYVVIRINAEMDPLEHSKILADRFTKLHNFYETTARIRGKYRYTAHGMYDYIDEEENTWPIAFESISPDTAGVTLGRAIIDETDDFYISPYFAYRGKGGTSCGPTTDVLYGLHSHPARMSQPSNHLVRHR